MNWIKTIFEIIKSNVKIRLAITALSTIIIFCKKIITLLPYGEETFSVLAIPSFFISLSSWIFIVIDIVYKIKDYLISFNNYRKYKNYILSIKGRKLNILKEMYKSKKHNKYLYLNDTDVVELQLENVIICPKNPSIAEGLIDPKEFSDSPFLCFLQPKALKIMEKNKTKFKMD